MNNHRNSSMVKTCNCQSIVKIIIIMIIIIIIIYPRPENTGLMSSGG